MAPDGTQGQLNPAVASPVQRLVGRRWLRLQIWSPQLSGLRHVQLSELGSDAFGASDEVEPGKASGLEQPLVGLVPIAILWRGICTSAGAEHATALRSKYNCSCGEDCLIEGVVLFAASVDALASLG